MQSQRPHYGNNKQSHQRKNTHSILVNIPSQDDINLFNELLSRLKTCKLNVNFKQRKSEYIDRSRALQTVHLLPQLQLFLEDMLKAELFPDAVIINQIINKLNQFQMTNQAILMLEIAIEKGFANAITYSSTIDAIAKSKNPDANKAIALLKVAKKNGFANGIIYINTIDAIALSKQSTNENTINKLMAEATQYFKFPSITPNAVINLHDLSFGMSYFWLKKEFLKWLDQQNDSLHLTLIVGRQTHSSNDLNMLREGVTKILIELKEMVQYQEDKTNSGRWNVVVGTNLKYEKTDPQSNVIASSQIKNGNNINKSLDSLNKHKSEIKSNTKPLELKPNTNTFIPQTQSEKSLNVNANTFIPQTQSVESLNANANIYIPHTQINHSLLFSNPVSFQNECHTISFVQHRENVNLRGNKL